MGRADRDKGLGFVDPSVDPLILPWKLLEGLATYGAVRLTVKTATEFLRRFPTTEYAIGFDGVDDWIMIDSLEIRKKGIDLEATIWIPEEAGSFSLLGFANKDDKHILSLINKPDGGLKIRAFYGNIGDTQKRPISGIKSETWHDLRIWSDGGTFSIEVDETQVSSISDIDLTDNEYKLYFGTGYNRLRCFKGMIKSLQVKSGSDELFDLRADKDFSVDDKTDSAVVAGIHNMKKGRFRKEFRA